MNNKNWLVIGVVVLVALGVWFYVDSREDVGLIPSYDRCSEDGHMFYSMRDCIDLELLAREVYWELLECERDTDGWSPHPDDPDAPPWVSSQHGDLCDRLRTQLASIYEMIRSCWECYGITY